MSSKNNKDYPARPRIYTTRQIMEITEQRRLKIEAENRELASRVKSSEKKPESAAPELKPQIIMPATDNPKIVEEIKTFVSQVNERPASETIEEYEDVLEESSEKVIKSDDIVEEFQEIKEESVPAQTPVNEKTVQEMYRVVHQEPEPIIEQATQESLEEPENIIEEPVLPVMEQGAQPFAEQLSGLLILVSSIGALYLLFSLKISNPLVHGLANKLNNLVYDGSFFILNMLPGSCTAVNGILDTHYYKISVQGDMVAFYSLGFLIVFTCVFAFYQKSDRTKRVVIFLSLLPLAILANIFRVVIACGMALNYGTVIANHHFYGNLVGLVFVFVFLGLILLEYLFSSD